MVSKSRGLTKVSQTEHTLGRSAPEARSATCRSSNALSRFSLRVCSDVGPPEPTIVTFFFYTSVCEKCQCRLAREGWADGRATDGRQPDDPTSTSQRSAEEGQEEAVVGQAGKRCNLCTMPTKKRESSGFLDS